MRAFRIVTFVVFVHSCLFGCDDTSEEIELDSGASDDAQIEAGDDSGEATFDGGAFDAGGPEGSIAEAGMDADIDGRTSPSRDAGYDNGDYCPPGIDEYDDAGVIKYVTDEFEGHDDDSVSKKLYFFCFTKGVDCEKYTVDASSTLYTESLPSDRVGRNQGVANYLVLGISIFHFPEDERLPTEIDPGIKGESGWKVVITGASVKYEEGSPPGCSGTPLPDLDLEGTLSMVQFEREDEDKPDFVVLKDEQGNVVLDTRE